MLRLARTLILTALVTACDHATDPVDPSTPSVPSFTVDHGVDVSLLVPLLSPTFTNWTCVPTGTGPVCRGERHIETGWEPTAEFPCAQPVYHQSTDFRRQTRYYDEDYLNFSRLFHLDQSISACLRPAKTRS
jgi:hypothetical protein